jgi:hypothetical protein
LRLGLLEGILKWVPLFTPRIFGVPDHARYSAEGEREGSLSAPP